MEITFRKTLMLSWKYQIKRWNVEQLLNKYQKVKNLWTQFKNIPNCCLDIETYKQMLISTFWIAKNLILDLETVNGYMDKQVAVKVDMPLIKKLHIS